MKTNAILTITLLLLITTFGSAKSQNYRVLQPDRTTMYQSQYEQILGMRVDSIRVSGSDTVYYLLKNLQQVDYNCYHTEGPSWMGDGITIRPDGETVFYNVSEQPVLIKTKALLNEEWICYSTQALSFRASITGTGVADIFGITDSVKTVSFQALNMDGQAIDHVVNDMNLILSKNHGLVKTLNFYNFPDFSFGITLNWLTELTLSGFDNPEAGIQNLTWKQVHDHTIGDELHTKSIESRAYYYKYIETIATLLEKTIAGDSIIYTWEEKVKTSIQSPDINTFIASIDTTTFLVITEPDFDNLSGVSWTSNYIGNDATVNFMGQGEHGITKSYGSMNVYFKGTETHFGDTCYTQVIICGCVTDNIYYKGLGGPYYYCNLGIDSYIRELVYYKKDGVEWGTPLEFTVNSPQIPVDPTNEVVSVFPNPANDQVNILFKNNSGEFRLQITDYSGREIAVHFLEGESNTLDLSILKPGIYMLRFITNNQIFIKKLIKQ
jgi:hypothetical protein